jgi:hypothetical protein
MRMPPALLALALAFGLAACVQSGAQVCSDGSICPRGYLCDVEHDRCIRPEQVAACEGKVDGDDCTVSDAPGTCRFGACEIWFCGDGIRHGTEACDGEDLGLDVDRDVPADCVSLGFYEPDGLACAPSTCTYDVSACGGGYCGDGMVNGPESCDGSTNTTCVAIGFDAGSLTCSSVCSYAIVNCNRFGWTPESLVDLVAYAVSGTARDDQWAVGAEGRALRFDGGFWIPEPTGVTNSLVGVWSIARDDVWAVGLGSTSPALAPVVIRWDGAAWSTVSGVPAGTYVDVWAAGPDAVFVAARDTGIHRWDGTSWTAVDSIPGTPIAIRGTSASDVWVATEEGPLQRWTGTSWTAATPPATAVKFLDANAPNDVWAIGHASGDPGAGVIAHFDGTSWTTWVTAQEIYNAVASSAPNDTWVAGVDGIMRHWDGIAWSRSLSVAALPGGHVGVSGFLSLGPAEVVAVSTARLAYRYRGQTFGQFRPLGPDPITATENLAVWGPRADDLWMTNAKGEVWRFDGAAWTLAFTVPGTDVPARAVWGTGASDVWVGAADGRVYHHDGQAWTTHELAPNIAIDAVWGSGSGEIWAFARSGTAYRKVGATWMSYPLAGSTRALSVSGSAANDVWVVTDGAPRKLWRWNGAAWGEVATGAPTPLLAVVALAPDDVHVSAEDGWMLRLAGTTWTSTQVLAVGQVRHLTATATDDVIAATERDLLHFDGIEWSPMRGPPELADTSILFAPVRAIQSTPGRIDLMLERYKVLTLLRTRPLRCRTSELIAGGCFDAVDNDCDGLIDALDSECQ